MGLSRYWPLAVLLLSLAGCSGSSPASPSTGKSAADLIENGNAALARGEFEKALADFNDAVDAQPDSARARERRGAAYVQLKKYDQAVNDCNEALKVDNKFAAAYYTRGLAEKNLGELAKALEDFTRALNNGLERVDVLVARGALYHSMAKASVRSDEAATTLEKALKDFDRALKLDPHNADARVRHAAICLDVGDYENAVADCDDALKTNPNLAAAYVNRARGECELSEIDHAIADCDSALHLDENLIEAYVVRARARLENASEMRTVAEVADCERAMVDCQAAINRSKKVKGDAEEMKHAKAMRAQAHELRGSIYQNLHVTKSSLAEFEKALSLDPYLVSALLRRAVTHAIAEDFADALNDCNTAISIDSARADAYCGRGMIFSVRSEFAKAIEDFTQAVQLNRKCAKAYSGRALVYSAMAGLEFEKAKKSRDPAESESCRQKAKELRQKCIEDATEAIHANRHMARAYLTRALANGNQGNLPNAINDLNAAIREDPKMIKAYYHRGMILARVGQVKAAISDFEEAIKLQPDNWRLDLLIAECYKQLGDAILMNQHLKAATEKKQRAQKDMADSLDDPAGMIAAPLKRQPELRPDVDLDPLETARKELEKKLDATRDR